MESGNVDGSIGEVVLDYLRMITHMDIVKFNKMTKLITAKSEDAYNLVDTWIHRDINCCCIIQGKPAILL